MNNTCIFGGLPVSSGSSTYWQLTTSTCSNVELASVLQGLQFILIVIAFFIVLSFVLAWYD